MSDRRYTALIVNLDASLSDGAFDVPSNLLTVSTEQEAGSVPEAAWIPWRKEKPLVSAGNKTVIHSYPVHSIVSIPTALHRFMVV
jgi:hypothetical protein